jgi:hypothetical protein
MQVDQVQRELADREAIRDVIMRYARGVDRVDTDLLHSVYWDDAVDDHTSFNGNAHEFVTWMVPRLKAMEQTVHFLGNIFVEIHGNFAAVESAFQAFHRLRDETRGPYDMVIGGRYVDRMEKRSGEWRIAYRKVLWDWYRTYPDSGDWANPVGGYPFRTNHRPGDFSYELFADVRKRGAAK